MKGMISCRTSYFPISVRSSVRPSVCLSEFFSDRAVHTVFFLQYRTVELLTLYLPRIVLALVLSAIDFGLSIETHTFNHNMTEYIVIYVSKKDEYRKISGAILFLLVHITLLYRAFFHICRAINVFHFISRGGGNLPL